MQSTPYGIRRKRWVVADAADPTTADCEAGTFLSRIRIARKGWVNAKYTHKINAISKNVSMINGNNTKSKFDK